MGFGSKKRQGSQRLLQIKAAGCQHWHHDVAQVAFKPVALHFGFGLQVPDDRLYAVSLFHPSLRGFAVFCCAFRHLASSSRSAILVVNVVLPVSALRSV